MELSQLTAVPRAGTRSSCPFGSRAVLAHKPLPRTILSANLGHASCITDSTGGAGLKWTLTLTHSADRACTPH